jgi:hypothetical protein
LQQHGCQHPAMAAAVSSTSTRSSNRFRRSQQPSVCHLRTGSSSNSR